MATTVVFEDRTDAGRRLGRHLVALRITADIVLALPRGGVPVAAEVAAILRVPLDALVVRKLGLPTEPEVAMGAIGEGGIRLLDDDLVRRAGVGAAAVRDVRALGAAHVVVAAPVGPPGVGRLVAGADRVICPAQPRAFRAVGEWYEDFTPTTDADVLRLLDAADPA